MVKFSSSPIKIVFYYPHVVLIEPHASFLKNIKVIVCHAFTINGDWRVQT